MVRVSTWNMKQAVAPKKPLAELWQWAEEAIAADVLVLTEAKIPKDGLPSGWTAIWTPGGIGERRRWGTVIAGRGVELVNVSSVEVRGRHIGIEAPWPSTLEIADVIIKGERWATVVGMYGLTVDAGGASCGHGRYSMPKLLDAMSPVLSSSRADRVVVAGDFNLWPRDLPHRLGQMGLVDLVEFTGNERSPLDRCANCDGNPGCAHLWTHKNGNSPNAAVQQIDFILATKELCGELDKVSGGSADFPDAWDVSDHAPVVADFF
jgi:exonuclease III